jgi:hypothetical protein
MNRLQKDLIHSRTAPNFFFNVNTYFFFVILIEIFILKTIMYHKYTLTYQKYKKKKIV